MADTNEFTLAGMEEERVLNLRDKEEKSELLLKTENLDRFDEDLDNFADSESRENTGEPNDSLLNNLQSAGLTSTTRPLMTTFDDEIVSDDKISTTANSGHSELPELLLLGDVNNYDLLGKDSSSLATDQRHVGDLLSIDDEDDSKSDNSEVYSTTPAAEPVSVSPVKTLESKAEDLKLDTKLPKIDTNPVTESSSPYHSGNRAYETIAQVTAKAESEVAMEADTSANALKSDGNCPFSPASWFNPEKLHPTVAEYIYWRDVKKSGIVFGSSLVLLLSLRFFSLISVVAYITLAVLSVTVSFRIYKNVLQAIQKANEGHPFKEYLDLDVTLSHDQLKDTAEVLIHHVNGITLKLRSLILVEDLFDTIKLAVFAWILTYVGAWFNGLTLIILALIAVFCIPKIYETKKAQIDVYAELLCTKVKELKEMVNAKMPLGKKKKEQ